MWRSYGYTAPTYPHKRRDRDGKFVIASHKAAYGVGDLSDIPGKVAHKILVCDRRGCGCIGQPVGRQDKRGAVKGYDSPSGTVVPSRRPALEYQNETMTETQATQAVDPYPLPLA
ncbi:hypothetical protein EVAR_48413_1 [Eumeta japonica]|uniref:Uncharacterized protein n=1 Tax=Eumeta variegata TaxID=151549 RepID=A0A4C1XPG6_EUMVA|nr:hypothetical protein EVAR_48413_1 [Eumeta japonica]